MKFTQYLMPDGCTRETSVQMPEETERKAADLVARGYKFDIEMLSTGAISMTCEPTDEDLLDESGAAAHELCANGPAVIESVKKLVDTAHAAVMTSPERSSR